MPYAVEIEFKNALTKDEFYHLSAMFKIATQDFVLQSNYYYDHDEILSEKQMSLRIRVRKGQQEITLKQKAVQSKHAQIEITVPFDYPLKESYDNIQDILPKEILNHLSMEQVTLEKVTCLGKVDTLRKELEYQGGKLCLDYNRFNDKEEDYELEFEYDSINLGETIFDNFLVQNNIPLKPTKSKIVRMLEFLGHDDITPYQL